MRPLQHPARLVPLTFLLAIAAGTVILMLPVSRTGGDGLALLPALFTATSAVTITGLAVVDTGTYWSGFGKAVILALVQVGGLGIMSGATLLGLLVARRLRLSTRLVAQAETRSLDLGDVADVLRLVLLATLLTEVATAAILAPRLHLAHGLPWDEAAWNALFLAVCAFNNAGFSLHPDNVIPYARDGVVLGALALGVTLGATGFPVLHDMRRNPRRPAKWSVHTKITLLGTVGLLLAGTLATLAYEWGNPATLGPMGPGTKLLNAAFHSAMTRSGGFNAVDVGKMAPETLAVTYGLMMIGGGSAGTGGGIKVSTFLILGLVVLAEARGEPDVVAFGRRISRETQRQALTVALLAVAVVGTATLLLLSVSHHPLQDVLFEAISAFATVGLSTGITGHLPPAGQVILVVLMFLGRVGTVTVATGLALRRQRSPYRYPEERPIVG